VADREAHIRDLAGRVEREPGSRYFVPLADEYRKAGRLAEAIRTLEAGLEAHAGYVAARIALARAYLEAGRIEESMAAFSKALADDPSNLVAAKALGDLHLSRGESLEALKRYRRYRGISGDRNLDALIRRLEEETAPRIRPTPEDVASLPPPVFQLGPVVDPQADAAALASVRELLAQREEPLVEPPTDPHDMSPILYERPSVPVPPPLEVPDLPSRDVSLDALASQPKPEEEIITRKIRLPQAMWPFEPAVPPEPTQPETSGSPAADEGAPEPATPTAAPAQPAGRTLADLYFAQQHYAEAYRVYADLLSADTTNDELLRLRDEAQRLAPAPAPPDLPAADPARERRLAKIRVLNEWLDVIRTGAGKRETGNGKRQSLER
jgi:tetratricopeptide (TPR) repeat protein